MLKVWGVLDPLDRTLQWSAWLWPDLPAPPGRALGVAPPHAGSPRLQAGPADHQPGPDHQPPAPRPSVHWSQGSQEENQWEVGGTLPRGALRQPDWRGCGPDRLHLLLYLRHGGGLQQTEGLLLSGFLASLPRPNISQVSNKEILYVSPTETL